jgi:hypothetical protein
MTTGATTTGARPQPIPASPPIVAGTPPEPVAQIAMPAEQARNRTDKRAGFWSNLFKKRK